VTAELGAEVEVETHIEPLQAPRLAGRDADPARIDTVRRTLGEIAAGFPGLRNVHEVRVRDTAEGEIVNFHCDADPSRSVIEVHGMVDDLERALRQRFPSIKRVIGHAEPR
jgi:divalent metal cation (Fe/Co/Zn/Cd) transporter